MAPQDANFRGVEPAGLADLIESIERDAHTLRDLLTTYTTEFSRHGVSTAGLSELARIGTWAEDQLPAMRRRHTLAQAIEKDGTTPFVAVSDKVLTLGEARDYGRDMALVYENILTDFNGDLQAGLIHDHIREIERLTRDPDAAAAFFTQLPPELRDALPNLILNTGSKTARGDLETFGRALGAALRSPTPPSGFAGVKAALLAPTTRVAAWNRLALMRAANLPTDFRVAAARALALDDFIRSPQGDFRAVDADEARTYGYPTDVVALALDILAPDGKAVRSAFSQMGAPGVTLSPADKMKAFLTYAQRSGTGDEVAASFGRAAASGAGVTTEKPGAHSPEAAAFAFDAILEMGRLREGIPRPSSEYAAQIAASYLHELLSGARSDRAADRSSGFGRPSEWIDLPGVNPRFYLKPGDTYAFLRTFAGYAPYVKDFDAAAGIFRVHVLDAAGRSDTVRDEGHFQRAAQSLGDFGALEFFAQEKVQGEQDARGEAIRNFIKNTAGIALSGTPAGEAASVAWTLGNAYIVGGVFDNWVDGPKNRVEILNEAREDLRVNQKYDIAGILYGSGFPASRPPPEIVDASTGKLISYDAMLRLAIDDAGRKGGTWKSHLDSRKRVFEGWLEMEVNKPFDTKIENAARTSVSPYARYELKNWN